MGSWLMVSLSSAVSVASPRKAVGMARGNVNPITHEVMADYSPSKVSSLLMLLYCSSFSVNSLTPVKTTKRLNPPYEFP